MAKKPNANDKLRIVVTIRSDINAELFEDLSPVPTYGRSERLRLLATFGAKVIAGNMVAAAPAEAGEPEREPVPKRLFRKIGGRLIDGIDDSVNKDW